MKRYDLTISEYNEPNMEESKYGKYVKWKDVKYAVAYWESAKKFEKELMEGTGTEKPKGKFYKNLTPKGVNPV